MPDTDHRNSLSGPPLLAVGATTRRVVQALPFVLILYTAVEFGAPHWLGRAPVFADFHVFHMAGELALRADLPRAYDFEAFWADQARLNPNAGEFMPWTYPAQFNLLLMPLAWLPLWLAYLVFMLGSYGAFLWVLRRLAGADATAVLILTLPALFVTIRSGQNGFLTAALMGAFCLLALDRRRAAGVPLGLMAIKPHLAVGVAVLALLRRRVAVLAIAGGVALASAGLASLMFGAEIWAAVAQSVQDSGAWLRDGRYPLFRKTSVFAWLSSWGAPAAVAMAAQIGVALAALAIIVWAHLQGWMLRRLLAVAVLASFLISPYNYDYDLCSLAVALALLMPDVARLAQRGERAVLATGCWLATGSGLIGYAVPDAVAGTLQGWTGSALPSSGAIFYLTVTACLVGIAARAERVRARSLPALARPVAE